MSDTPRTDAVDMQGKEVHAAFFEMRSLAWQLEREIAAMREQRDKLAEALREITTYDPIDRQCDNGYSCKYVAQQALDTIQPNQ
jgi:hypothetical protein